MTHSWLSISWSHPSMHLRARALWNEWDLEMSAVNSTVLMCMWIKALTLIVGENIRRAMNWQYMYNKQINAWMNNNVLSTERCSLRMNTRINLLSDLNVQWVRCSQPKGPMCLAIHTTNISQFAATFNDARNQEIHRSCSWLYLILLH